VQDWSEALFASFNDKLVPGWLGVIALRRLGADAIPAPDRARLLQAVVDIRIQGGTLSSTLDDEMERMRLAFGIGPVISSDAARTAIIVRQDQTEAFRRWRHMPRNSVVLVVTVVQARRLARQFRRLLRALPGNFEIKVEEPADELRFTYARLELSQAMQNLNVWGKFRRQLRSILGVSSLLALFSTRGRRGGDEGSIAEIMDR
jgi:hypothetical protein